ncbi:MAG: PH domain-containing protein [Thermoleophilaceae bacterium]
MSDAPADRPGEHAGGAFDPAGGGARDADALPPRRLHPAGAILSALDNVREALITLVVVFVIGSRASDLGPRGAIVLAVGGALVALATGYVSWRRERYEIVDGAIRHRRGVISPDETVVPLARLHSIDTSEGPVQRLFGVRELHVQTAGGGARGEIVLRAVSEEAASELRVAAGLPEPAATDLPEWRLSPRRLLLAALTAPQIGVLLPLVAGAVALVDRALGDEAREGLLARLPTEPAAVAMLVAALAAGSSGEASSSAGSRPCRCAACTPRR